jgi:hypothetical protein
MRIFIISVSWIFEAVRIKQNLKDGWMDGGDFLPKGVAPKLPLYFELEERSALLH